MKGENVLRLYRHLFILSLLAVLFGCAQQRPQTVILLSIDGFRWDYMDRADTPNLDLLANDGVRAKSLIPCFPTKTFPNHYSMVTGLYPGHHGIVANNMYDPERDAWFGLSLREAVADSAWWGGVPIWVTAEQEGLTTAPFFWPGSETAIQGVRPHFWLPFDQTLTNIERTDRVLQWLDLPKPQRPRFLTLYFNSVDDAGHEMSPESPEIAQAIQAADSAVGYLIAALQERRLFQNVNLVVVSDHGMAKTSTDSVIVIDDYIDLDDAQIVDWDPVAAINPKPGKEKEVLQQLRQAHPRLQVFEKDEMPARFHYRENPRIPRIIAIADEGWIIKSRAALAALSEQQSTNSDGSGHTPPSHLAGAHGYDNSLASMGGFFVAHGPAFRRGLQVGRFQNIHIYEMIMHILRLEPAPNDGSLDSVRVMLRF